MNMYRYMSRGDMVFRRQGAFQLNSTIFTSADEAYARAAGVSPSRAPFVFEVEQARAVAQACRESRGTPGRFAPYCDCLCCTASRLLDEDAARNRKLECEVLGGISHDQLLALEAFGMVRRMGSLESPKARETVYELTGDGRALLENCIKSRGR
jgi:hypothetical protein